MLGVCKCMFSPCCPVLTTAMSARCGRWVSTALPAQRTTEFMPAKPLRWMPRFASFVSWPRSAEKVPSKSAVPCKHQRGTALSCPCAQRLGTLHHVHCTDNIV